MQSRKLWARAHPANHAVLYTLCSGGAPSLSLTSTFVRAARRAEDRVFVAGLEGHEDSVQDIAFEPGGDKYLLSASSDGSFAMWQ